MGKRSSCSWERSRESSRGGAGADPVGLVSVQVLRRKQQSKNLQIFLENLHLSSEIIQPVCSSLAHIC